MSDQDDDERDGEGAPRFRRRARVTLKWDVAPLLLPGEEALHADAPRGEDLTDSTELALPPEDELEALPPRPPSIPPPGEAPTGSDGWQRQRPRLTPPPMHAVADTRPPSLHPEAHLDAPDVDAGDALSLVDSRGRPSRPGIDLTTEMHDRYAFGDYTAALSAAELILGRDPTDAEAIAVCHASREKLASLFLARLGSLEAVPRPVEDVDVRWLGLHHRGAFLLSRVDGVASVEQILDVSGMPRLEALRTLVELLEAGAIVA